MAVKCSYIVRCKYKGSSTACKTCVHNTERNKIEDYYEKANDNPIPDKCPKLTYSGPAEQTAGYKCPVCGEHTNPYMLREDHLCPYCGYELNV